MGKTVVIGAMALVAAPVVAVGPAVAAKAPAPAQVCMVNSPDGGTPLTVFAAIDQQSSLALRGYVVAACPDDPQAFPKYRAQMCRLAQDGNSAVDSWFQRNWSTVPAELCAMAKAVSPQNAVGN